MKKYALGVALIGLVFFTTQCSKNQEEEMPAEVRLQKQINQAENLKSQGPEIEWMLYCEGACDDCSGKGVKLAPTVYECQCSQQCALKIARIPVGSPSSPSEDEITLARRQIDSLTNIYGTFSNQLQRSMTERYQMSDFRVDKVELHANRSSFALKYFVTDLSTERSTTISYMKHAGDETGYEVDCNGGCTAASAKCAERIYLGSPIRIECTCEGDCKMDVTPSEGEPGLR